MPKQTWDEVETAANNAFNVWVGNPELGWAKHAWTLIAESQLGEYSNELERHIAAFRFFALADLYLDFCKVGFDEEVESDYSQWIEDLKLSELHIGILSARTAGCDVDNLDDENPIGQLAQALSADARGAILPVLTRGFGGQPKLFESLWLSRNDKSDITDDDRADVFFEITGEKMRAWAWMEQGCQSCRF
jgi:hypothetical protein